MHTTEVTATFSMNQKSLLKLTEDIAESARLDRAFAVASWDGECCVAAVAVHRVALPDDGAVVSRRLNGTNVGREVFSDLVVAVAGNENDLADFLCRIEDVKERDNVLWRHCRAKFHTYWVADTTEVFDMSMSELAGPVADPDEVGRSVVMGHEWVRG